jgi:hypothetical protein
MRKHTTLRVLSTAAVLALLPAAALAQDPLRISEIFWDGPGGVGPDVGTVMGNPFAQVYIEIRGTPGTSLDNHYLLFLESENVALAPNNIRSNVDNVFNLQGRVIGSNGFTLLLPNGFNRPNAPIAPGTTVYRNTTGLGYGEASSSFGHTSSIGNGDVENGAYVATLVRRDSGAIPTINTRLDANFDGVLDPAVVAGWNFLDSVGQAEPNEVNSWAYAGPFFSADEVATPNISAGATQINSGIEPEMLMRWGSSTGSAPRDWAVVNITNDPFVFDPATLDRDGLPVSGPHVPADPLPGEIVRGRATNDLAANRQSGQRNAAPEGALIQNNLGRPNFPIRDGDLNQNEVGDFADLSIVLTNFGVTNPSRLGHWASGDPSGNGTVGYEDMELVIANFGRRNSNDINAAGTPVRFSYEARYNLVGSGSWTNAANYTGTIAEWPTPAAGVVPNAAGAVANFTQIQASPVVITLGSSVTVGTVNFDSPNSYTVSGTGSITFSAPGSAATISSVGANHAINVPVTFNTNAYVHVAQLTTLNLVGTTTLATGTSFTKLGSGSLVLPRFLGDGAVTVARGAVLASSGQIGTVRSLAIESGASLDILGGALVVRSGGYSPIATLLSSNRLHSSLVNTGGRNDFATLGAIPNSLSGLALYSSFLGTPVTPTDTLVRFTYRGDTNLDGTLNAADFNAVLSGLTNSLTGWQNGDINYDGTVNGTDWSLFLSAYNFVLGGGLPFSNDASPAGSIPEPTSAAILLAGTALFARRRRA